MCVLVRIEIHHQLVSAPIRSLAPTRWYCFPDVTESHDERQDAQVVDKASLQFILDAPVCEATEEPTEAFVQAEARRLRQREYERRYRERKRVSRSKSGCQ